MLSGLATWVQDVIEQLGYWGVALLVIIENVFPPIPSEIVLPFAGFVAQRGDASVYLMILAATIGSVIGALVLYYIAAAIGPERLRHFVVRYGKWFGVKESDLTKAFVGSAVWNIVLIGAGAILGDNWDAVADYISIFQYLVIAGILLLVVRFAFTIIKRRKG